VGSSWARLVKNSVESPFRLDSGSHGMVKPGLLPSGVMGGSAFLGAKNLQIRGTWSMIESVSRNWFLSFGETETR
jgi:hypothetical protein